MDRIRESRRGGGGSGAVSGHASSRRRPRSGFKDSSVACEEDEGLNESHDSTRLRSSNNNNNKKERSSLSSSRNKRKRPGLQERFHGSNSRDRERERENDGADDSSEDSGGDEDEDDDDEPPRPANPTKTTKFKSQWKVSEEIFAPVLGSFPRKARSASVKRVHDSSSVLVAAGSDGPVHRQPSPSPARPSVIPASPSSSNVSVKPGKRMKPIGTKPRPSKMAKAPPAKSSLDIENDSRPDAVGNVASELPEKGTVENASASEVKTAAVKKEKEPEKREEEVKVEQTEKKHDKIDNAEEKGLEKRHVKERDIDLQMEGETLEKDSSKQHLQKQSKIPKNESRTQKPERPVSAPIEAGNVSSSVSAVASLPVPMTVPSWPGGLHPLGYFGPAGANWPGAPSLQGVISMEGTNTTPTIQPAYIMQQSRQTWKRCATHSYIAHFIKCQQQMARNPFWAAANYGSSVALFGAKPYNLNMPLPPPSESINLVGSLSGTVSASSVGNGGSSSRNLGSLQERNIGSPALAAFNSQNSKEKASTSYMDVRRKQPLHQQVPQQTTSTIMQHGPTFGFPLTQSGVGGANSSAASNTGNAGPSLNVGNPGLGTVPSSGTGAANSSFASMASQDAPYLAMFPQSYPFAISHAHFGATYNGAPNHIGQQQAAQFFNGSFYAAQMLHPPPPQPQPQQQGPQNPSTSTITRAQHVSLPCMG